MYLIILVQDKYYLEDLTKDECLDILIENSFISKEKSLEIYKNFINVNNYYLENYISYIELSYLFDENCIINKNMNYETFLNKVFLNGFMPVSYYKSILN